MLTVMEGFNMFCIVQCAFVQSMLAYIEFCFFLWPNSSYIFSCLRFCVAHVSAYSVTLQCLAQVMYILLPPVSLVQSFSTRNRSLTYTVLFRGNVHNVENIHTHLQASNEFNLPSESPSQVCPHSLCLQKSHFYYRCFLSAKYGRRNVIQSNIA